MIAPTRIVAVRHGETDWNARSRLQGHRDIALNAAGHEQARRLAGALHDEGLTLVVSSDLVRAVETARPLSLALGLPLQIDAGLRERGFGQMEGMSYREVDEREPEWGRQWRQRAPDFAPPGGETLRAFAARCVAAAERLALAHRGAAIALVTHGGVLDCLYRAAAGIALDAPRTWQLGNAAINRLLHAGEGFTLVGWNDTQHLQGESIDERF